jgi:hypothetical protein
MTLRRAHAHSTSALPSWRRTLAVAVLALVMSVAPRAVELCDATCALAHSHQQASSHCVKHAAAGHMLASAHACQPHGHPLLQTVIASVGLARTTFTASVVSAAQANYSAAPTAIMPATDLLSHAALNSSCPDRLSACFARSRPLTASLRI